MVLGSIYYVSTFSTVSRSFRRFVSCSLRAEFHIKVWSFLAQIFAFEVNYWPLGGVNDSKSKFYQVKKQGKQTTKAVVPGSNTVSLTVEDRQSHYLYCKVSGQRGKSPPEVKKRKKRRELAVLMISYLPPSLLLSSFQTERDSVTRFVLPHFFLSLQ